MALFYKKGKEIQHFLFTSTILLFEGAKCVVLKDNEYHRATVQSRSETSANVKLVDIGTDMDCELSDVYELRPDLSTYPQLAFPCAIAGISPVESDLWSNKASEVFRDSVLELSTCKNLPASAKATIVSVDNDIVQIELSIDRVDIADVLVEKGVALLMDGTISVIEDKGDQKLGHANTQKNEFGVFKNVILDTDCDYDVVMVDSEDVDRLVFHTKATSETMDKIAKCIAEFVEGKSGGEGIEGLESGPCLAKCPEDGIWYRANLLRVGPVGTDDQGSDVKFQVG